MLISGGTLKEKNYLKEEIEMFERIKNLAKRKPSN